LSERNGAHNAGGLLVHIADHAARHVASNHYGETRFRLRKFLDILCCAYAPTDIVNTFWVLTALFSDRKTVGSAPLFLSLTRYYPADQRKMLSRRIALNSIG